MPIINEASTFSLSCKNGIIQKKDIYFKYQKALSKNQIHYYIHVADSDCISKVVNYIPRFVLNKILHGNFHLMIGCELESFVDIIDLIYRELVLKSNIPAKKIIYVTGTLDATDALNNAILKYNQEKINVYFFSATEHHINGRQRQVTYENKNIKNKRFLCFNRRWRLHRPFLVSLLHSKNLLDNGYVSLGKSGDNQNWNTVFHDLCHIHNELPCSETLKILQENKDNILNIPDMYLDTSDLVTNHEWFIDQTIPLYENSYFSVITETNYFTDIRFITEKTFKAIMMRHPFILVSSPHSLKTVRDLGYKTFHPYINEDYDKEENHSIRMKMIVDEIERLCNLEENKFIELMNELHSIVEYNYQVLKSKNTMDDYIRKI